MKKILHILLCICCLFCGLFTNGCRTGEYTDEYFYGVVEYEYEYNQWVMYIPSLGLVRIPESDKTRASFETGEIGNYTLQEGDVISVQFRRKNAWDDHGVQLSEIYPACFDRKAYEIVAYKQNVRFGKNEQGYYMSFPMQENLQEIKLEDSLYFIDTAYVGGRLYAQCAVTQIQNHQISVQFPFDAKIEKNFFAKYIQVLEIRTMWGTD